MPDYDASNPGSSDAWTAAPAAAEPYDPVAAAVNANTGLPAGVPGLPVGSTGQAPATPPVGPRADAAPAAPGTPPGLAPPTPGAPATGFGALVQGVKDFFTGNTTVGDYKGGGAPKTSTDGSRDLGQTAGQQQHNADEAAAKQSTDPPPKSWWTGMF